MASNLHVQVLENAVSLADGSWGGPILNFEKQLEIVDGSVKTFKLCFNLLLDLREFLVLACLVHKSMDRVNELSAKVNKDARNTCKTMLSCESSCLLSKIFIINVITKNACPI